MGDVIPTFTRAYRYANTPKTQTFPIELAIFAHHEVLLSRQRRSMRRAKYVSYPTQNIRANSIYPFTHMTPLKFKFLVLQRTRYHSVLK